jgi:hypothetical protein
MKVLLLLVVLLLFVDYIYIHTKSINKQLLQSKLDTLYNTFKSKFTKIPGDQTFFVDCVYCIVMPKRKDHLAKVLNNVNVVYLDAITPADLTDNDIKLLSTTFDFSILNYFSMYNKKTKIALQLSHVMCYLHAVEHKYNTFVIFEDDIKINELSTLERDINEFKKSGYHLFYLGYCALNCYDTYEMSNHLITVNEKMHCTHAIAYKLQYIPSILQFIFVMNAPIDVMLNKYTKKHKNSTCISQKTYFDQDDDLGTTLQQIIPGKKPNTSPCNSLKIKING